MKIVQANLQRDYGGAEIHVRTLANGLRSRGHAVRVFCHPNGRLRQLVERDGIPTTAFLARNQLALRATLRMTAFLLRTRPDVIHLHTPKDYVCGMVAARLAHVPAVVITRHLLRTLKPVMRSLYLRADAVVCMSQGLRFLLRGQGIPEEKLFLLHAAIDVDPFDVSADTVRVAKLRREWDVKPEDIVVGCPGRLVGGKGQEVLLDAFARSCRKDLRLRLIFVGEGAERQALETRALRLGVAKRTRFIGFSEDMRQT